MGIPEVSNALRKKLNEEVYTWYISGDRWLLKLNYNRGKFREDIIKMCPLCIKKVNTRQHVINECESTYYLKRDLISKVRKEVKVKKGILVWDLMLEFYHADNRAVDLGTRRKVLKLIRHFARGLFGLYSEVKV